MMKRPAWREAAREAMRAACGQEAPGSLPSFNYRWEHVQTVVRLARRLAELTGADVDVVEAAAWLHDIEKGVGEDHAAVGARAARRLLLQTDFPGDKLDRVVEAIAAHKGLWRDEPLEGLEAQILWDADKLTKIGLTGAVQLALNGATGQPGAAPATTVEILAALRPPDWAERTVASMHTAPARRAALSRLAAARALWDGLERELGGEDLKGA